MKLCANCRWQKDGLFCRAPQNLETDPVTGRQVTKGASTCWAHRNSIGSCWLLCRIEGLCGREGRWFVPADAAAKGGAK